MLPIREQLAVMMRNLENAAAQLTALKNKLGKRTIMREWVQALNVQAGHALESVHLADDQLTHLTNDLIIMCRKQPWFYGPDGGEQFERDAQS